MDSFAAPDHQDPWQIGHIIHDRLEVKGILGEGSMGRVYHVYCHSGKRDVAIKRPFPTIFTRDDGKEAFIREVAKTWFEVEGHKHITTCYSIETIAHIPCPVVEYMAGGSLADWIEDEKGPLYQGEPTQVVASLLDLALQMAHALGYVHFLGQIHQNVKPANVLLDSQGIARLTDVGLARARFLAGEETRASRAGMSGAVPGAGVMTVAYASPEQVEGEFLTRRTDIWSWAILVLDLFMGATARGYGPDAAEALENYLREGPADPLLPPMPPGVVTLLRQCFQHNPAARPTGMNEVVTVLQGIIAELRGSP